jgi:ATP-dependent protease HslVU (ClpYQ) ATPase subunit
MTTTNHNAVVPSLEEIREKAMTPEKHIDRRWQDREARIAQPIIRRHYQLGRSVTEREAKDEIANLRRKLAKGNLDDMDSHLMASLEVAGISFD